MKAHTHIKIDMNKEMENKKMRIAGQIEDEDNG